MADKICLGFDFGYKRIGVAVGQTLTKTANPLKTLSAQQGVPNWNEIQQLVKQWQANIIVVGLPTCIDDTEQYTTSAAKSFAQEIHQRFHLPVYLVDERLTTIEARERLFAHGGYRKIKKSEVDSIAASIILEQWLNHPNEVL